MGVLDTYTPTLVSVRVKVVGLYGPTKAHYVYLCAMASFLSIFNRWRPLCVLLFYPFGCSTSVILTSREKRTIMKRGEIVAVKEEEQSL